MKKLSIDEALQLYEIIGDYIPKDALDEADFIGTIVHGIRTSGKPRDYLNALSLMTEYSVDEILQGIDPEVSVKMFYEGLLLNQVKSLKEFCDRLNHG